MKYVWGILIIALGAVMVIKTDWFVENFGHSEWAEEHFGGGGTRLMYKVLGIAIIFLSLMGMTGMLGEVIVKVFGRLFGI
ncbi:MAG: hypothetical protein COY69_00125 [Candidatus Magasanikbacteria bacterium CG_4_10_14_0_8_um_filter_32_14]|uniref:Uncharacterized protein n=2 Tax=Candidatus Magasanikiibacteriota TaxID=1752731 RepID=A0A2M7RAW9_9BACT|nr:MAG: hypothetical protein AUJ23_03315 [Candidatus Magasanikbacteria bacterium CG1_02_32_51]PIY93711.1 MAG: hypothetical protein COY69_00125 [Candidatus Magasanikbacteria bacterium CG_4_10_14_0_8_um_filter_32_14]